jgi:hypothetical protein
MSSLTPLSSIAEVDAAAAGRTVPRDFLELVRAHPSSPALHSMRDDGGWNAWTLQEFSEQVAKAAAGLTGAGVSAGERILLMMRNRPDFHWFDPPPSSSGRRRSASTTRRRPRRSSTSPVTPKRASPSSRTPASSSGS